jgi:peptidoglycan hydrolase CwlO-like protein
MVGVRLLLTRYIRVRSLSIIIQDVDVVLPQRDITDKQKVELSSITQACRNVLSELEQKINKYQELDSSADNLKSKTRRVWKRLKWDQSDIDEFRRRITSNIVLLNTFLGRVNR